MICEKNVRKYCCEDISLIENYYEAINSNEMWVCHHRLEIQGDEKYSTRQLIEMRLYYERPANELIFLSKQQHASLHILINHVKHLGIKVKKVYKFVGTKINLGIKKQKKRLVIL